LAIESLFSYWDLADLSMFLCFLLVEERVFEWWFLAVERASESFLAWDLLVVERVEERVWEWVV